MATQSKTIIPVDTINEQVVIAAACVSTEARTKLVQRVRPSHFAVAEHQAIWDALMDLSRRGLDYDAATLKTLTAGKVDASYVEQLCELRPDSPPNIDFHVEGLLWDHARIEAVRGPLAALLGALKNSAEAPERVRSLAQQLAASFDGYGQRRHLLDPGMLVRTQSAEIEERMGGRFWPFGLDGLDFDAEGNPRLTIGSKPGHITVVTGVSGAGKSTLVAWLILGLARAKRRVLVGAWEMSAGITVELLATLSLGYSRTAVMLGKITREEKDTLVDRMEQIAQRVRFLENPFRRQRSKGTKDAKPSNERNLDVIQGYLSDSGCDVFVADLWKRCLVRDDPGEEEFALYEQQAMAEDMKVHCILVQQQRNKDIEQRQDKRPTREGIMGSSAWVQVADNIFGANRPALWKPLDDNIFELSVLKQRYGKWPQMIEFDWNSARGSITGGRTVEYEHTIAQNEEGGMMKDFGKPNRNKGGRR